MIQFDKIFITGTDTGIGKTIVSLLLMKYFYAKNKNPFYIKPCQSGCTNAYDTDSDANFIYSNIQELQDRDPSQSIIYCHRNPKAPLFAAKDDNDSIAIDSIISSIKSFKEKYSHLIIEGAGGVHVPITADLMMIDLMKMLGFPVIVVAKSGLGTINHTLLTLEALQSRDIPVLSVVFNSFEKNYPDPITIAENKEAVEKFSGIPVLGPIDYIMNFSLYNNFDFLEHSK